MGPSTQRRRGFFRGGGFGLLYERAGLRNQLLNTRSIAPREVRKIPEAGDGTDFRVDKRGVLGGGFLEIDDGFRQIVLEILGVGGIVEAVNGAAPEGKAAPIAYARADFFVGHEGRELGVKTLEGGAIARVIGLLNLRNNFYHGFACGLGRGCEGRTR
jgi:hypothetical protein